MQIQGQLQITAILARYQEIWILQRRWPPRTSMCNDLASRQVVAPVLPSARYLKHFLLFKEMGRVRELLKSANK